MTYKVLAIVKFNNDIALVLDKKPIITYEQHGNDLIGFDESGTFYDFFYYDKPSGSFYAFAGSKFDLQLKNGDSIHCYGQWWSGISETARKTVGKEICHVTWQDVDSLRDCYVFSGQSCDKEKHDKLISSYNGKIYDYWEYEKILKSEVQSRHRQINEIQQRAEKAAQGPWILGGCSGRMITTPDGYVGDGFIADVDTLANADFIAHSRQDIPNLLAHIAELSEKIGQLEAEKRHFDNGHTCAMCRAEGGNRK